jgi:hypothetical protein
VQEEEIHKMVNEVFKEIGVDEDVEKSLSVIEQLVSQMEELITADYMWENAIDDETSRRVICAAVGVIALKFADVTEGMIDFINDEDE